MKGAYVLVLTLIAISVLLGVYLYPRMPEQMASHWNAQGQVDGYTSKFWGLFLMPLLVFVLFLFFLIIPRLDPLKANIEKFRRYYEGFVVLATVFFLYMHVLTILWSLGVSFDLNQALVPAMGLLFFAAGVMLDHAKRNWFIGIRTPWTLSSDEVWTKTHRLGGKLFRLSGLVAMLGIFFPQHSLLFVLVPVLLAAAYTTLYSYLEYGKVTNGIK